MPNQAELLPGTLDMLILKAVSLGPLHGYGVLLRIEQISQGALLVEQGALYPALFRLVRKGLLMWVASKLPPATSASIGVKSRAFVSLTSVRETHGSAPKARSR